MARLLWQHLAHNTPLVPPPGGLPTATVQFLEPQRGSYVNPALPRSRARGLEYMRALLQSMRMLRMYYRSCANCKIFCAAIPYPRLEVLNRITAVTADAL